MPKHHITLSGETHMVAVARAAIGVLLAGYPCAEDAELIVSEATTNSILYSRSGEVGGFFQLSIDAKPGLVHLEITDDGPKHRPLHFRVDDDDLPEYGRGLMLVHTLATRWGDHRGAGYATLWVDLEYTVPPAIEGQ